MERLAEVDRMRSGYQDLAVKNLTTFEELGAKLTELENTRATAVRELEALRNFRERIDQMEQNREATLQYYADLTPEALDSLTPEERHQFYTMGGLEVVADVEDRIEVTGSLAVKSPVCLSDSAS